MSGNRGSSDSGEVAIDCSVELKMKFRYRLDDGSKENFEKLVMKHNA